MVLGHLPNKYKVKGRVLLHHLRSTGGKWSNKGELFSSSGDVILGSNAVDLAREILVGSRRMKQNYAEKLGWGEFMQMLDKPMSLDHYLERRRPLANCKSPMKSNTTQEPMVSPEMKNHRDHYNMAQYLTG